MQHELPAPAKRVPLLLLAVWFGLLTGLAQVALRAALTLIGHRKLFDSPHIAWMTPVADVALFVTVALILALILWKQPYSLRLRVSTFAFVLLVFWSGYVLYPRIHWAAALVLGIGIAFQSARWMTSHSSRLGPWITRSAAAMAILVGLLAGTVALRTTLVERRQLSALSKAPAGGRNVIFIILDTVRAASMSLYGYSRPTTPNLRALAQHSIVFDRAYSPSPWTLPSHGSMFTGHPAHELSANWRDPLDDTYPTVAERLRARGFATAGFVANMEYGSSQFGLGRGFIHYSDYTVSPMTIAKSSMLTRIVLARVRAMMGIRTDMARKRATSINKHFLAWATANDERPFFAFLNYINAHNPYTPPAPFDTRFGPRKTQVDLSLKDRNWSAAQIQMEVDAYDGAIAYLDDELGRLVDELRNRGLLDNTVIVISSDHGEHFGEHGLLYHANSLYLPLLHVPLMIMIPGGPAGRVPDPITLTEIPATLLELAGVSDKVAPFPGHSLARFWDARPNQPSNPTPIAASVQKTINMAAWLPSSQGDMRSIINGAWQIIQTGTGTYEFFDAVADPLGVRNLVDSPAVRPEVQRLRARMQERLTTARQD